jgi:hypothetical protein
VNGMRRVAIILLALAAATVASAQEAPDPSPDSATLVEEAKEWDSRTVTFTGEAVGESMRRGATAWIHLNDDAYGLAEGPGQRLAGFNSGIGILVDAALAGLIGVFGDYGHHGDVVEVTGVFHAACPVHGGDMDIHAASLRIVRTGRGVEHPVIPRRLLAAGVLCALTALLFVVHTLLRRQAQLPR